MGLQNFLKQGRNVLFGLALAYLPYCCTPTFNNKRNSTFTFYNGSVSYEMSSRDLERLNPLFQLKYGEIYNNSMMIIIYFDPENPISLDDTHNNKAALVRCDKMIQVFEEADRDSDGKISSEEVDLFFKSPEKTLENKIIDQKGAIQI